MVAHRKAMGSFHDNHCCQCPALVGTYRGHAEHVRQAHGGVWRHKCGLCAEHFGTAEERDAHRDSTEHSDKKDQRIVFPECGVFKNKSEGRGFGPDYRRKIFFLPM